MLKFAFDQIALMEHKYVSWCHSCFYLTHSETNLPNYHFSLLTSMTTAGSSKSSRNRRKLYSSTACMCRAVATFKIVEQKTFSVGQIFVFTMHLKQIFRGTIGWHKNIWRGTSPEYHPGIRAWVSTDSV